MPEMTVVSLDDYPSIIEALNTIESDNSFSASPPVRSIPKRWEPYLASIEETLSKLSRTERAPEAEPLPPHVKPSEFLDSEFYAFCSGEQLEQQAIANRNIEHARATVFLADFFEDWGYTGGNELSPANKTIATRIEWLEYVDRESSVGLSPEQQEELDKLRFELT